VRGRPPACCCPTRALPRAKVFLSRNELPFRALLYFFARIASAMVAETPFAACPSCPLCVAQAQVLSTVRTTLDSVSNPLLMISGVQLADKVRSSFCPRPCPCHLSGLPSHFATPTCLRRLTLQCTFSFFFRVFFFFFCSFFFLPPPFHFCTEGQFLPVSPCRPPLFAMVVQVASGGLGAADSSLVHRVLGLLAAPLLRVGVPAPQCVC